MGASTHPSFFARVAARAPQGVELTAALRLFSHVHVYEDAVHAFEMRSRREQYAQ